MKISIPIPPRKPRSVAPGGRVLFVAAAFAVGGCAMAPVPAPFPLRPDTVIPGDLTGPYEGRIVDAESGKPVEGAAVLASWAFEAGAGLTGPQAASARLVETDADGRYRVGRVPSVVESARLERFTLVVYKRGYVAYRSDRRFDDLSVRRDFAQTGNVVRLERFKPSQSHARHLRFLGAGGPLLAKLGWELQEAALEASAPAEKAPAPAGGEGDLDASVLITGDEIRAVTGYAGEFTIAKLEDHPTDANNDSLVFHGAGFGKADATIRLFKVDPASAEKQYEVLRKEVPGASDANEVGDRSLRAKSEEVFLVAALDRARGVVLVFTCGADLCKDEGTAAGLVKRMWPRLARLGRTP